jgi:hypothetical protein
VSSKYILNSGLPAPPVRKLMLLGLSVRFVIICSSFIVVPRLFFVRGSLPSRLVQEKGEIVF